MDEPVYVEPAALPPVLDEDKKELMRDFWAGVERRPDAVHVFGTHDMGTEDLNEYFAEFNPGHVEWINDASANVVFMTADGAKQALFAKGPEVYPRPNTEQLPEEHLWRVGVEHPKASDGLFLRLATVFDVKEAGAALRSRYYALYGASATNLRFNRQLIPRAKPAPSPTSSAEKKREWRDGGSHGGAGKKHGRGRRQGRGGNRWAHDKFSSTSASNDIDDDDVHQSDPMASDNYNDDSMLDQGQDGDEDAALDEDDLPPSRQRRGRGHHRFNTSASEGKPQGTVISASTGSGEGGGGGGKGKRGGSAISKFISKEDLASLITDVNNDERRRARAERFAAQSS